MSKVSMISVTSRGLRRTQKVVRKATAEFKKAVKETKKNPSEATNERLVEMFRELEIEILDAEAIVRQADRQGFKTETLRALTEEGRNVMKERAMARSEPLGKEGASEEEGEESEDEEESEREDKGEERKRKEDKKDKRREKESEDKEGKSDVEGGRRQRSS